MQGTDMVRLNERAVKVARAAELTGYSVAHIYRLVREGKIPYHKRAGRSNKGAVRFYESEINDWIKNGWEFSPAQDDIHAEAEKLLGGTV